MLFRSPVTSRRERWSLPELEGPPPSSQRLDRSTRSIRPGDLQVVYQPIVALDSGRTFAAEALVRCSWPEYSNPVALFRQAESEHTCGRLGRMIRDLTFRAAPSLPMFVNVHPHDEVVANQVCLCKRHAFRIQTLKHEVRVVRLIENDTDD